MPGRQEKGRHPREGSGSAAVAVGLDSRESDRGRHRSQGTAPRRAGRTAALALFIVAIFGQPAHAEKVFQSGGSFYYSFLLILGVVIAVPQATWLILSGFRARRRAATSPGWPTTAGRVTESEVIRSRSFWTRYLISTYRASVAYEYSVAGTSHIGRVVEFGLGSLWQSSEADAIVAAYPVGAKVTVHHDPERPDLACLSASNAAANRRIREGWLTLPMMFLPVLIMLFYHEVLGL